MIHRLLRRALILAVALSASLGAAPAAAKRIALVIGNGAYTDDSLTPLRNPVNDAEAMAMVFKTLGFDVELLKDVDVGAMTDALAAFGRRARDVDAPVEIAAVYYAGHAVQFQSENYLFGVDAAPTSVARLPKSGLSLQEIQDELAGAPGLRLIVLDACRDNGVVRAIKSAAPNLARTASLERGLAPLIDRRTEGDTFIAYATAPGAIAADGDDGPNSPYTAALVKHLPTPGMEIERVFRRIRASVRDATGGVQSPDHLPRIGDRSYYLAPKAPEPAAAPAAVADPLRGGTDAQEAARANADANRVDGEKRVGAGVIAAPPRRVEEDPADPEGLAPDLAPDDLAAAPNAPEIGAPRAEPAPDAAPAPRPVARLRPGDRFDDCAGAGWCPSMVVVPAGRFVMGSPKDEPGAGSAEWPRVEIEIPRPFAVGRLEVTRDQYAVFAEETGRKGGGCYGGDWSGGRGMKNFKRRDARSWRNPGFEQDGDHPAICLSARDAAAYVAWLAKKTGAPYRLLSEAEWEYAARAGSTAAYPWGADAAPTCGFANGNDATSARVNRYKWATLPCDDGNPHTAGPDGFAPNAFGLVHMIGNAWEAVADCWSKSHKGASTTAAPRRGGCDRHVVRGGSWDDRPSYLRAAYRVPLPRGVRTHVAGLRVARDLP